MSLTIPNEQIAQFVAEAFLRSVDDNARDTLIKSAIMSLLQPQGNNKKNLIEEEFIRTCGYQAQAMVRELLDKDPKYKEMLKNTVEKAVTTFLTSDKLEGMLTAGLAQAFRGY